MRLVVPSRESELYIKSRVLVLSLAWTWIKKNFTRKGWMFVCCSSNHQFKTLVLSPSVTCDVHVLFPSSCRRTRSCMLWRTRSGRWKRPIPKWMVSVWDRMETVECLWLVMKPSSPQSPPQMGNSPSTTLPPSSPPLMGPLWMRVNQPPSDRPNTECGYNFHA